MKYGKKVCELLKDIRKQIADDNGIEYTPISCDHEGDCPGTCPQCDKELKELQEKIDEMEHRNKPITIDIDKAIKSFWNFKRIDRENEPIVLGGCPVPTPIEESAEGNFSSDDEDLPF